VCWKVLHNSFATKRFIILVVMLSEKQEPRKLYWPMELDHDTLHSGCAHLKTYQAARASLWHFQDLKKAHVHGQCCWGGGEQFANWNHMYIGRGEINLSAYNLVTVHKIHVTVVYLSAETIIARARTKIH
jgi:hypothetical protein